MIGLVYTDSGTDKLIKQSGNSYAMDIPSAIHNGSLLVNAASNSIFYLFKNSFFTSKNSNLFRFVNVTITPANTFTFSETPTEATGEKVAFVSNDNANIVVYRSGSYQVVTVASLVYSEIPDVGLLSFTAMQSVMTAAATLTSPQIKYIAPVQNDTVTFVEL